MDALVPPVAALSRLGEEAGPRPLGGEETAFIQEGRALARVHAQLARQRALGVNVYGEGREPAIGQSNREMVGSGRLAAPALRRRYGDSHGLGGWCHPLSGMRPRLPAQ